MGLDLNYINGQTPIDEDEKLDLLIPTISNRRELDEFEQANIQQAVEWTINNKFTADRILTEEFVLLLHKRMFNEVWKWAGAFRKSDKNIGVDKFQIAIHLKQLLDDCKTWIAQKTYDPDEIAIRFSHRIVCIHLFPNGNGRHSRLIADVIISHVFQLPVYSWGSGNIANKGIIRDTYLSAIYLADQGDYSKLIHFARS